MERTDDERLPLPSEDGGDLVEPPVEGLTDDPLVATAEGVPWSPPMDRVMSAVRDDQAGPDVAGTDPTDAGELEREDGIQLDDGTLPRDDELAADVVEALRNSDVVAGDRFVVTAVGSVVTLRGEVESIDVLAEILGMVGDVRGVTEVRDQVTLTGA